MAGIDYQAPQLQQIQSQQKDYDLELNQMIERLQRNRGMLV